MEQNVYEVIEELVHPDILDVLSMAEIKAGVAASTNCECDHGSCYNGATLEKNN